MYEQLTGRDTSPGRRGEIAFDSRLSREGVYRQGLYVKCSLLKEKEGKTNVGKLKANAVLPATDPHGDKRDVQKSRKFTESYEDVRRRVAANTLSTLAESHQSLPLCLSSE